MSDKSGDEFRVYGTDNKGNRLPEQSGFSSDWNVIRALYLHDNPTAVHIRMEVAIPDKSALAAGTTNGQLAEKSGG